MEVNLRVIHIDLVNQYYQVVYMYVCMCVCVCVYIYIYTLLTEFDYKYMKSQFKEK